MILEPIVNPWLFYALDVLGSLRVFALIASVGFGLCMLWFWGTYADEDTDFHSKGLPIFFTFMCCLNIVLRIVIPSEETMYKMAVAKYVTPDNIEAVTDYVGETASAATDKISETVVDIIDYAGEKIYELRNNVNPNEGE